MSLVKLDLRQESERHMDAVDAITMYLGIGSYKSWSEEEKQAWLLKELQGKRPLFGADLETSDEVKEVLDTFRVIAEFPTESFGAYVISMVSLEPCLRQTSSRRCGIQTLLESRYRVRQSFCSSARSLPVFRTVEGRKGEGLSKREREDELRNTHRHEPKRQLHSLSLFLHLDGTINAM
jgi:hypothetical protein